MKSKRFYNTIGATGQMLIDFELRSMKQRDIILDFMTRHGDESFTPIKLEELLRAQGQTILLTSIRKHLSNLTNDEELIMNAEKIAEKYGAENHTWQLNRRKDRPQRAA